MVRAADVTPGVRVRFNVAAHPLAEPHHVWLLALAVIPHEDGVVLVLADNANAEAQPFFLHPDQEVAVR